MGNNIETVLENKLYKEILNDPSILPCGKKCKGCPHVREDDIRTIALYRRFKWFMNECVLKAKGGPFTNTDDVEVTSFGKHSPFSEEYLTNLFQEVATVASITSIKTHLDEAFFKSITEKNSFHVITEFYEIIREIRPDIIDRFKMTL